jgi:hypothetical protein
VRRLLLHVFAVLAHLAHRVLALVIPGNHGELRRDTATIASDNWNIETVVGVQDTLGIAGGYAAIHDGSAQQWAGGVAPSGGSCRPRRPGWLPMPARGRAAASGRYQASTP